MKRSGQWLLDEKYGGQETPEYEADKKRLAEGEPLAYVIGHQPFLGLNIYLDSRPLIPRPETEWWTEQLISSLQAAQASPIEGRTERGGASQNNFSATLFPYEQSDLGNKKCPCGAEKYAVPKAGSPARPLTFLDLCAGSGAIGCAALARLPNAQVYFGEIDSTHEATVLKNFRENKLDESRAEVRIGDLFEPFDDMVFDIIAANPPYVPASRVLPASVANYEPALALFAGKDGLDIIRRIAEELPKRLNKDGVAWIECDRGHAKTTSAIFEERGFRTEIRDDQYGKPRIVVVHHTK